MIITTVIEKTRSPLSKKSIERICVIASKEEKKIKGELEITIVGGRTMRRLNREHRGIDKVTDVLSFAWQEDSVIETDMLGELYICPEKIRAQAKEFEVTPKEEFVRMLVHGLLHLVGYDHMGDKEAARMFALQEKIAARAMKVV